MFELRQLWKQVRAKEVGSGERASRQMKKERERGVKLHGMALGCITHCVQH